MPTVSFVTLGCRVNQYDSQALRERAAEAAYREVPFDEGADVVVVNACTVTAAADSEGRALVRRARRLNPSSLVVLTGCLPADEPGKPAPGTIADLVVPNTDKPSLFHKVAVLRSLNVHPPVNEINTRDPWVGGITRFDGHQRAILKVQEGCPFACSFCRVPQVRGGPVSRPLEAVLSEARQLAGKGVREMVLTGIQLASYGRECGKKVSEPRLTPVVEGILSLPGVRRVRLSSYSIADFEDALLPLLGKGLCPHLHLPLQSGDAFVLKSMRRPYTLKRFEETLRKIRSAFPGIGVTTDLIAGFPGESSEAFENTVNAVRQFGFSDIHPFPYSDRPGTESAAKGEKINPAQVRERMKILLALKDECLRSSAEKAAGMVWDVVAERSAPGNLAGTTDRGLKVRFAVGHYSPGQELRLRVVGFHGGRTDGEVISYVPTCPPPLDC